jgi:hypothetical protein
MLEDIKGAAKDQGVPLDCSADLDGLVSVLSLRLFGADASETKSNAPTREQRDLTQKHAKLANTLLLRTLCAEGNASMRVVRREDLPTSTATTATATPTNNSNKTTTATKQQYAHKHHTNNNARQHQPL